MVNKKRNFTANHIALRVLTYVTCFNIKKKLALDVISH